MLYRCVSRCFFCQKTASKFLIPAFLKVAGSNVRFSQVSLKRTPLYQFHVKNEGKMVPFAGYEMPVQYGKHSIIDSHIHTREHASIFDVSHMLQTRITGKDRISFMESLVVCDIQGLKEGTGSLSVFTNSKGGILDDLIVTKAKEGYLYVVSNASCAETDLKHMKENLQNFCKNGLEANIEVIENYALLALQGPSSMKVLQPHLNMDLTKFFFMNSSEATLCGVPNCRVSRCGYTGEDGFELSVPSDKVEFILETLLASKDDKVLLAGLGARDTLRLEAGLCLYGNDIDETTTPVEAGLAWTIGKRRRATADFPGASVILQQLKDKPSRKRIGIKSNGPPARSGVEILSQSGKVIGKVTSGAPSPILKTNISMGYVEAKESTVGNQVKLLIRKKEVDADVVKMPFVKSNYFTAK